METVTTEQCLFTRPIPVLRQEVWDYEKSYEKWLELFDVASRNTRLHLLRKYGTAVVPTQSVMMGLINRGIDSILMVEAGKGYVGDCLFRAGMRVLAHSDGPSSCSYQVERGGVWKAGIRGYDALLLWDSWNAQAANIFHGTSGRFVAVGGVEDVNCLRFIEGVSGKWSQVGWEELPTLSPIEGARTGLWTFKRA
jgi:hypothetical protein